MSKRAAEEKMLGLARLAADERTDEHTARNAAMALAKLVVARGLPDEAPCPECAKREEEWSNATGNPTREAAESYDDIDLDEVMRQMNEAFGFGPARRSKAKK